MSPIQPALFSPETLRTHPKLSRQAAVLQVTREMLKPHKPPPACALALSYLVFDILPPLFGDVSCSVAARFPYLATFVQLVQ